MPGEARLRPVPGAPGIPRGEGRGREGKGGEAGTAPPLLFSHTVFHAVCCPPRAGDDFQGLGFRSGTHCWGRCTNFLIPSATLGMTVSSLGLIFPNCTIGEAAAASPLPGLPCPQPRVGLLARRELKVSAHFPFVPLHPTAAWALSLPSSPSRKGHRVDDATALASPLLPN